MKYQMESLRRQAEMAESSTSSRLIWWVAVSVPAVRSRGTLGIGKPICSAAIQPKMMI
jgi:hypothetical protein